jgi:DNA-directed RNA polymerase subunit RPC12/RpoP
MPISSATITLICPTCSSLFPVNVEVEENDLPPLGSTLLQTTASYRCPDCEHLGELRIDVHAD